MAIKDYEIKQKVVSNGTFKNYKKSFYYTEINGKSNYIKNPNYYDLCIHYLHQMDLEDMRVCRNLKASEYKKNRRARDYITHMLNYDCIFLTLTFTDHVLASTSPETRRKYVIRFLKDVSPVYIANIDYGRQKGREHYHAIVLADIDYSLWKHGAINGKRVVVNNHAALAKYVVKFANHATKETTKRAHMIYPKKPLQTFVYDV